MGIGDAVGAATGVLGGITGKNNQKAASGAANSASQAEQQVNQQLLGNIQNQTNQYNSQYAPALAPLSAGLQSEGQVAAGDSSQLASMLLQAGMDPSTISQLTGVNSQGINNTALNYLQNTAGTNLAQATPQASSFYGSELQNGINPQYAQNAQNQISQSLNQQLADARNNAAPGQNMNGLTQSLQNNALTAHANLAGSLAGQNQAVQQQGASGLLNSANALDTQTAGMLQNAGTASNALNQQAFQNLGTSTSSANSILSALQSFIGQGQGAVQAGYSPLAGVANSYGTAATNAANQASAAGQGAANSFGSAASSLANLFPQATSTQSTPSAAGNYSATSTAGLPFGPSATGNGAYTGATASPLGTSALLNPSNSTSTAPPLSVSTPTSGNFTPGLFTGGIMAGQNYAA